MIRVASLLSLAAVLAALLIGNYFGQLHLVETLLGILAIIFFAVLASGWTINHDDI